MHIRCISAVARNAGTLECRRTQQDCIGKLAGLPAVADTGKIIDARLQKSGRHARVNHFSSAGVTQWANTPHHEDCAVASLGLVKIFRVTRYGYWASKPWDEGRRGRRHCQIEHRQRSLGRFGFEANLASH